LLRQKVEWWWPGNGEKRNGELLFNGHRVSIWQRQKSFAMDGDDGYECTYYQ
jgi:hypothetical protein